MANMNEPAACNLIGKMVVIRNMDNTSQMNTEYIENMISMDGNAAILDSTADTAEMDQNMNSVTGKIVIITNLDDIIGITTNNITCNTTQSMSMIRNMGNDP